MSTKGILLDGMGFSGLVLLGLGCWMIYPPVAFIAVGSVLLSLTVISALR